MAKKTYTLHDEVIAEIAKNLQRALLTGTDIVDNLRQMTVCMNRNDSTITLSKEYVQTMEVNDARLVSEAEELADNKKSDEFTLSVSNSPLFN